MIRANDKGLTPPPVVVDGEPRRRLPIPALSRRTLIIIVGVVAWLVVIYIVLGATVFAKKAPAAGEAAPAASAAPVQAAAVPASAPAPGSVPVTLGPKALPAPELVLKDRVVNLNNTTGFKYAKMTLAVIFADEGGTFAKAKGDAQAKLQTAFAADNAGTLDAFNDIVTTTVSAKTASELASPQGKEALRQDLIAKFNQALAGHGKVTWIDFTDFVMQ